MVLLAGMCMGQGLFCDDAPETVSHDHEWALKYPVAASNAGFSVSSGFRAAIHSRGT